MQVFTRINTPTFAMYTVVFGRGGPRLALTQIIALIVSTIVKLTSDSTAWWEKNDEAHDYYSSSICNRIVQQILSIPRHLSLSVDSLNL